MIPVINMFLMVKFIDLVSSCWNTSPPGFSSRRSELFLVAIEVNEPVAATSHRPDLLSESRRAPGLGCDFRGLPRSNTRRVPDLGFTARIELQVLSESADNFLGFRVENVGTAESR